MDNLQQVTKGILSSIQAIINNSQSATTMKDFKRDSFRVSRPSGHWSCWKQPPTDWSILRPESRPKTPIAFCTELIRNTTTIGQHQPMYLTVGDWDAVTILHKRIFHTFGHSALTKKLTQPVCVDPFSSARKGSKKTSHTSWTFHAIGRIHKRFFPIAQLRNRQPNPWGSSFSNSSSTWPSR